MGTWIEGEIFDSEIRLHYYRTGGIKPPVVMVHGFTDNALYWTHTAKALEGVYDVIMYDARGHGASDRAKGRFSEQDRIDDLLRVIQALKLEQPGLIGHSMGGATIANTLAQQPTLARWAILEDPAWKDIPEPTSIHQAAIMVQERYAYVESWREWLICLQVNAWEDALRKLREESPKWSELDAKLSLDARRQFEMDLFNYFPPERMEWRNAVPYLNIPFLLLTSHPERGGVVSPEIARETIRLAPSGRWVQFPEVGHSIRFDDFEAYFKAVKAFLKDVDNVDL
ncbi:MAG: alpha/beta hydrolase [Anaerolineales bacterium]|nr:alpha/beta hydrolase [Anaerolineales bacterium]